LIIFIANVDNTLAIFYNDDSNIIKKIGVSPSSSLGRYDPVTHIGRLTLLQWGRLRGSEGETGPLPVSFY